MKSTRNQVEKISNFFENIELATSDIFSKHPESQIIMEVI